MLIAKVPRPSHHEEKISDFFMEWAKNEGLNPVKDSVNNVMFEVPATAGMEDKPLGIIQAHMDMVLAVEDGKEFNPLTDTVTVKINEKEGTLTADGTSLGADDGIGIAMAMAIVQGKMAHGPLKVILTVCEEDGMIGAFNVDKSWLDGASFLINIDSEVASEVLVSTASGDSVHLDKKLSYVSPTGNMAIKIVLSNLQGGHSGMEIDKGRLNGIIGLANFLKELDIDGIKYELASLVGGTAGNAIPTKASATLVIDAYDKEKIEEKLSNYCDMLNEKYRDIEKDIKCEITSVDTIPQVISKEEKNNVVKFITNVIDGIYTWSKDMEGLVESSSNLGIFKLNEEGLSFTTMIRSSSATKEKEIVDAELKLANECAYDSGSKLLKLAKEVYKNQNGEEIKVVAIHAGVECGTFKSLKPELDMISVGPVIAGAHTVNETLNINSIPKVWHLVEGILAE